MWDSKRIKSSLTIAEYAGKPLRNGATYWWTVHVWRDEKGAPIRAPLQRFTFRKRRLPSLRPHLRTFVNFGSHNEEIARHYDLCFRKNAKKFRRDVLCLNYSLIATMVIPSERAKMFERWCISRRLTRKGIPEAMFCHFAVDTKVTLHQGAELPGRPRITKTVPGWNPKNDRNGDGYVDDDEMRNLVDPNAHARRMSDARIPIYYWGPPKFDYVMNVGHPEYQWFMAEVYAPHQLRGYDGLYFDTCPPYVPGPGRIAQVLEYPRKVGEANKWLHDMQMLLAKIKCALPDVLIIANNWEATPFVIDGMQRENWLNITAPPDKVESAVKAVRALDRRGKNQLVQYNPIYTPDEPSFGVKVPVSRERDQIFGLACYYLAAGDFAYFGYGRHPYANSERKHFPAMDVDIGEPLGEMFVFAEGSPMDLKGKNLLVNGDFEIANENGNPAHWQIAEPVEVVGEGRNGSRCARIVSTSRTINNINKQYVKLKPHTTYTLAGWIRTRNVDGSPGAQIYPYEFEGMTGGAPITVCGTTEWRLYATVFTTGDDAYGRINFRIYGATGTAWFDDIVLLEGSHVPWKIFARRFTKGLVLVKPSPDGRYDDSTATTVHLPKPMRRLHANGQLEPPTTELKLRNGEAAILIY